MNKQEIESRLREKYDDEYTIKMFTNFVVEFQTCFSDYVQTEEVIERIKKNVFGNIKVVKELASKDLDGQYQDGYIYLKESAVKDERYVKYLLFHEMLHAITSVRDENGKQVMLGLSYIENEYGRGFNEALTELLTMERNRIIEKDSTGLTSGYRTVVEQMRRLLTIVGKREVIEKYFYDPNGFKDLIQDKGMDYDELENAFTCLCGKDVEINILGNGLKGDLLPDNEDYDKYKYMETIYKSFSKAIGKVQSLDDFERKYSIFQNTEDFYSSGMKSINFTYFQDIARDIISLNDNNVKMEDINKVLGKLKISLGYVKATNYFSQFLVEDRNESAKKLYDFYMKHPDDYELVTKNNFAQIEAHFNQKSYIPLDEELTNIRRYVVIGKLLKEHPELDFNDLSYDRLYDKKSDIDFYHFYDSEGNDYFYDYRLSRLAQAKTEKKVATRYWVDQNLGIDFTFNKETGSINYGVLGNDKARVQSYLQGMDVRSNSVKSLARVLEVFVKKGIDTTGEFEKKLIRIKKQIKDRKRKDNDVPIE